MWLAVTCARRPSYPELQLFSCEMCALSRLIGARRLHTLMERILEEISFLAGDKDDMVINALITINNKLF